jgi:hypothetical protein
VEIRGFSAFQKKSKINVDFICEHCDNGELQSKESLNKNLNPNQNKNPRTKPSEIPPPSSRIHGIAAWQPLRTNPQKRKPT